MPAMSADELAQDREFSCFASRPHSGAQKRKYCPASVKLPGAGALTRPKREAASCRPTPSSDSAVSSTLELAQSRLFLQGTTPTSAFERPSLSLQSGGSQKRARLADAPGVTKHTSRCRHFNDAELAPDIAAAHSTATSELHAAAHSSHPTQQPSWFPTPPSSQHGGSVGWEEPLLSSALGTAQQQSLPHASALNPGYATYSRPEQDPLEAGHLELPSLPLGDDCSSDADEQLTAWSLPRLPPGVHGDAASLLPLTQSMLREWLNLGLPSQSAALGAQPIHPQPCPSEPRQHSSAELPRSMTPAENPSVSDYASLQDTSCASRLSYPQSWGSSCLQPADVQQQQQQHHYHVGAVPLIHSQQQQQQQAMPPQTARLQGYGAKLPLDLAAESLCDPAAATQPMACESMPPWHQHAQPSMHPRSGYTHAAAQHMHIGPREVENSRSSTHAWQEESHVQQWGHSANAQHGSSESAEYAATLQSRNSHTAAACTNGYPFQGIGQMDPLGIPDGQNLFAEQQQQQYVGTLLQQHQRHMTAFVQLQQRQQLKQQQVLLQQQQQQQQQYCSLLRTHQVAASHLGTQLQQPSGYLQPSQVLHLARQKSQHATISASQQQQPSCLAAHIRLQYAAGDQQVSHLFQSSQQHCQQAAYSQVAAPMTRPATAAAPGFLTLAPHATYQPAGSQLQQQSSQTYRFPYAVSADCVRAIAYAQPAGPAQHTASTHVACSRPAGVRLQVQQSMPCSVQQRVRMHEAGHQALGVHRSPSMVIMELVSKCACMLELEQMDTVKLTVHLYGRIRSQVTGSKVIVEGRVVGMPLLLAGCLWIASKLEEGRKRVPSTTKMAALACTDRTLIAAVEVHLMDLLSWQPLRGWHSC